VLNAFRKVSGLIFNMSRGMQEWYEASWTGRIPVHEIRFEIEKT
jgi:hypothetical protein